MAESRLLAGAHILPTSEAHQVDTKPSKQTMTRVSSVMRKLDDIEAMIADLRKHDPLYGTSLLTELVRTVEETSDIDGFGAGGGGNGIPPGGVSRPVETMAMRDLDPERIPPNDETSVRIERMLASITEMHGASREVRARYRKFQVDRAKASGRTNSVQQCQACTCDVSGAENDRLRSAYCESCYRVWRRAGSPDRAAFEKARRAEIDAREPVESGKK